MLDDLAALRMGVRVDFPGDMRLDYHTAGGGRLPDGSPYGVRRASGGAGDTVLSNRYYLADADFLVGMESHDIYLLRCLDDALRNPVWQLCLGRKAFVPGVPVYIPGGLRVGERLEDALTVYPWPRWDVDVPVPRNRPEALRLSIEDDVGEDVRMDQPTCFSFHTRRFLPRRVKNDFCKLGLDAGEVPVRADAEEDANVLVTTGA